MRGPGDLRVCYCAEYGGIRGILKTSCDRLVTSGVDFAAERTFMFLESTPRYLPTALETRESEPSRTMSSIHSAISDKY